MRIATWSSSVHSDVGVHSDVVILSRRYDETRLWWLFIAFGKRSVYVLDGGYDGYMAGAMRPTTLATPPPRPRGTWQPTPQLDATLLATRADVLRLRGNQEARLWDVRLPGEYDGTLTMKGAARPGRVPWASARRLALLPAARRHVVLARRDPRSGEGIAQRGA